MKSNREIVRSILARNHTESARRLRAGDTGKNAQTAPIRFTRDDIDALENAVLRSAPRSARADSLLTTLHAMIRALEPGNQQLRQTAVFEYPKYKNIVASRFPEADGIYENAAQWLEKRRRAQFPDAATSAISEIVVAAIIEFQVLNIDTVFPLLESFRNIRIIPMHQYLVGIPVALGAWGNESTPKRFLTIGGPMATRFKELLGAPQVKTSLAQCLEAAGGKVPELIARINLELVATCKPGHEFTIATLIEATCQVAMFRMPTSIRAVRCGLATSHALDIDVLNRIANKGKPSKFNNFKRKERPAEEREEDDQELKDDNEEGEGGGDNGEEGGEPEWMVQLRAAVKKKFIDDRGLADLAEGENACGRSAAKFAKTLRREKCSDSTIYRYVFLIANRLLLRLGDRDPVNLELDEWEELVEQILDEDVFYHRKIYSEGSNRDQTGYSKLLLKALRRFARHMNAGGKDVNPVAKMIPSGGLIHVNAQMVTVDEYLRALAWFRSWRASGISNHLKAAARVALILGFRCGLRQAEVAYLRGCDFDAIGEHELLANANLHLHVRPWFLRHLKTSNALRDLPLNVLIPQEELEELMAFVDEARKAGGAKVRLFHSERDPGKGMKFERVLAELKIAFETREKGMPGVDGFHFHLLRHSAANLWLLKLWPGLGQVARHVFRRHKQTLEWISHNEAFRQSLFGNSLTHSADLQAVALLMGHGAAATTVEHYLHVLDWYREDKGNFGIR